MPATAAERFPESAASSSGAGGTIQHVVGRFLDLLVAFGGDRDHHRRSGLLLPSGSRRSFRSESWKARSLSYHGRDDHDRKVLVDQRVGAVLHFAGGVAFRVDVRNFLQLERAFECDGIVNAAAQEEEILRRDDTPSPGPRILLRASAACSSLPGNAGEFLNRLFGTSALMVPRCWARIQREQEKRGKLRRESLGRSHADLRSGVRDR